MKYYQKRKQSLILRGGGSGGGGGGGGGAGALFGDFQKAFNLGYKTHMKHKHVLKTLLSAFILRLS